MQRTALLAAGLLALAPAASAQTAGPVVVSDAWTRPAAEGTIAGGFMTVMNHGRQPAALVKAQSPLARKVEIHRSAMSGGVMTMSAQAKVDLPPGGRVTFAPGGFHLMFFGVTKALKVGDRLPATLTFAGGRTVKVDFAVRTAAPTGPKMDH